MSATRSSTNDVGARGLNRGPRWRRSARAAAAAAFTLVAFAVAAPSASADPWSCDAFGYLFQSPNYSATDPDAEPHLVQRIDLATGDDSTMPGGTENTVNAVGYNVLEDYFYGWDLVTGNIVRIHSDLSMDQITPPAPIPAGTLSVVGDVDPQGRYWVWTGSVYYAIDFAPGSPTYGQVVATGTTSTPAGLAGGADWAWIGGFLYLLGRDATTGEAHLIRMNPTTGAQASVFPAGLGFNITGIGAVYVDARGFLYGSENSTGFIYRVNPATGQAIRISDDGPQSASNDGARCASAPIPTVTVQKTVDGRVRPADQFTVSLVQPDGDTATSATTTGAATTASTADWPTTQGATYTITDAMAAGSPTPLGEYVKSIRCVDGAGTPVATGGSGPSWSLLIASPTDYTCTVTNQGRADVEIVKSTSDPVVPGEEATYTLTMTNHGPSTAVNARASDPLPSGLSFVSASDGCSEAGGTVTCSAPALAVGATETFTVTARVDASADDCEALRNTVTATSDVPDPEESNNTSSVCNFERRSDLSLAKRPSSGQVPSGGQVMYTLVVKNGGPSDNDNVTVTDPMTAGLTLVSAEPSQGSCSTAGGDVSCDLGRLGAGGSAQVLVTAQLTAVSGCVTNTATVRGDAFDPTPANNSGSAEVCVAPPPDPRFDLRVRKTASDRDVAVRERVRYRIVVRNNGPEAAPDVTLTDTLSAPVKVVSVRASAGSCTRRIPMRCELGTIAAGERVTIRITAKHRKPGCNQRNAASATGDGTDANPGNNLDRVDVCVRRVRLQLTKRASTATVRAGGTLRYRIRVRNRSKGVARNVRVCDRMPGDLAFVSAQPRARRIGNQRCWTVRRLGAGKSRSYRITARALPGANGRTVNRATANGAGVAPRRATSPVRVIRGLPGVTG